MLFDGLAMVSSLSPAGLVNAYLCEHLNWCSLSPSAGGPSLPGERATLCGLPASDRGGPATARPDHQDRGEDAVGLVGRQLEHPQVPQHPRDWLDWDRESRNELLLGQS